MPAQCRPPARIFLEAVSRRVEVSSKYGENPQSSVRLGCSFRWLALVLPNTPFLRYSRRRCQSVMVPRFPNAIDHWGNSRFTLRTATSTC
jgi:hypothetical protein